MDCDNGTLVASLVGLIAWFIRVDVPAVVGLPIDDAEVVLSSKQLNYRIEESDKAATGLASRVIQQQPTAGTGTIKGSFVKLLVTQSALTGAPRSPPSSAQDAEFRKAIVGKWRTIALYNGFPLDQQATFSPDGRVNWKGEYTFLGLRLPYALSGTWRVKDGRLEYKVDRSTIANFVPVGHTGYSEILAITSEEFAYVDVDGGTSVDLRIK